MKGSQTPHILMVDDEAAIRELYTLYLNTQGFDVSTASNAIDALDISYRKKFDVVMLDVGLGDSNGMDLLEPIRIALPDATVLVYTAMEIDETLRNEALSRGAARIFSKSHPLDYIVGEIKRALVTRAKASSL